MEEFAALIDALVYTRSRNGKLALFADYLRRTPDPDRGWALAALTDGLDFKAVKAGTVRALIMERVDPELFALSRDFVGDTAETSDSCEFALIIGEAWQGQGIGRRLLRALIEEAESRGLRRMTSHILLDNRPMLALARHQGFTIDTSPDEPQTRTASLELPRRSTRQPASLWQRLLARLRPAAR